jgi:hypothetical protein
MGNTGVPGVVPTWALSVSVTWVPRGLVPVTRAVLVKGVVTLATWQV